MNSTIKCVHCGREFAISDALKHELEETVKKDVLAKVEEKQNIELTDLKKQLEEQKAKNDEYIQKELELRKEKREIEQREKNLEIEMARKLDEQRKKLEEKIIEAKDEEYKLKLKEQEEEKESLKRKIEELNRKASHAGSQQLQGEVLELDLEERLRQTFPTDEIDAVGKGVRGGDILQIVKNNLGKNTGVILWETKRANWTPSWLPKLRDDARAAGVSLSVLVSEELPKDIKTFGVIDGVLITAYSFAIPLAYILRRQLIAVSAAKTSSIHKDEKLEILYQYLQSDSFRHRFEAYAEGIIEMQNDLESEKRAMERLWKRREMQIKKSEFNISNLYGELQGIMGSSLPDIKILSLGTGEEIKEE